ncbi:Ribosomal large subunit pseudouridine synthase B [invertebrate metagenome]|uniref:Ribosomal large subunit pseudouridine synthase B n=1 Tax=invertebrate metagenome TaxID=1711999 RepID=A0A2H9TAW0_9ZZZZ
MIEKTIYQTSSQSGSGSVRLQKLLASAGVGSRRKIEQMISEGRIAVNGEVVHLGDRATREDVITLDGREISIRPSTACRRIIMYNKPEGEVCSRFDPEGRPTVFSRLPKLKGERWISIGRLDLNTSGLLLFTNDGALAHRLMHPSYTIEREYAVRVMGHVTPDDIDALFSGVELEDGTARFTDIVDAGGTGINHWFHVCLLEGRKREVRRLWEARGLKVSRLKRVRYGSALMTAELRMGQWKELDQSEADGLAELVDLPSVPVKSCYDMPKKQALSSARRDGQFKTTRARTKQSGQRKVSQSRISKQSWGNSPRKTSPDKEMDRRNESHRPSSSLFRSRKQPTRRK